MKKNIDLVIDGIAPEKVMYDTDNHSLVVLYPAQEEFKRGDIVIHDNTSRVAIFDEYEYGTNKKDFKAITSMMNISNGTYTGVTFNRHWNTDTLRMATDNEAKLLFDLLKKIGKRWNRDTLEIEDIVDEFKRGDIVIHDNTKRVSIFDSCKNKHSWFNAIFSIDRRGDIDYNESWVTDTVRYATSSEIEKFDNDLKEIGKKWNAETLQVEDLDISDIVIDLKTACEYLNKKVPNFSSLFCSLPVEDYNKYYAQITLQIIREAWNKHDGFEVDYANSEQEKYSPGLDVHGYIKYLISWETIHISASNLSFPTQERAIQFGNQFKELLKTAMDYETTR